MTFSSCSRASILGALLVLAPVGAHAHGRPLQVDQVALDPDAPDRVVLQTTFGLAVSDDAGASWRWVCAAVYRADPVLEDPALAVAGGAVITGTFTGAAAARPPLCDWSFPEGAARGVYVPALAADPSVAGRVWGVASDGRVPDRVLRSDDAGESWQAVGPPIDDILIESIRRAPSDPDRVYLAGAIAVGAMTPRGFVLTSRDGAAAFTSTELTLEDTERFPLVVAVDPTDADRVFVRVVRRALATEPERLLVSDDGGASFREVFALPAMFGVAISADGQTIYAGSADGGLFAAPMATLAFTRVNDVTVRCLEASADALWICVDQRVNGFALGRSTDGGASVEPRFYIDRVQELPACAECSLTGFVCPRWQDDLRADQAQYFGDGGGVSTGLPRDAGDFALCGMDAGTFDAGARDAGAADAGEREPGPTCGCRAVGAGGAPPWLLLVALALARLSGRSRS